MKKLIGMILLLFVLSTTAFPQQDTLWTLVDNLNVDNPTHMLSDTSVYGLSYRWGFNTDSAKIAYTRYEKFYIKTFSAKKLQASFRGIGGQMRVALDVYYNATHVGSTSFGVVRSSGKFENIVFNFADTSTAVSFNRIKIFFRYLDGETGNRVVFMDNLIGTSANDTTVKIDPVGDEDLPVELISFTANVFKSDVRLKWETATETNNYGFEIERKRPNESESWKRIGFVSGNGTTIQKHDYEFLDKFPSGGNYYYRLKQIDTDGKFEYSNVVKVAIIPLKFSLEQNYPNPFNPVTTIRYTIPESGKVQLEIYNVLGQKIETLVNKNQDVGYYEVKWDMKNYSNGIYFYSLKAGNFSSIKRMILVK